MTSATRACAWCGWSTDADGLCPECLARIQGEADDRAARLGALLEPPGGQGAAGGAGGNVDGAAEAGGLIFRSTRELREQAPPGTEWVWEGYLARHAITLLAGKPKAGKSTLACAIAEAVEARAASFLGRPVTGGPVVYVSEEGTETLLAKLPARDDLRALTREGAWPKPPWEVLVETAVEEALRVGAALLVVDTFSFWASLPADAEKDAGAVGRAMAALLLAAGAGLAVLLVHHQRKAGGEDGDAIRGSTALAASVDVIVELERPPGEAAPGHRQVLAVGRWPTPPPLLLVERDAATGGWRVVGEGAGRADAGSVAWRDRLLRALPVEQPGATYGDLERVLGVKKAKWLPTLDRLVEEGAVIRVGEGKKGDPYRHRRAAADSVPGFHNPPVMETPAEGPTDSIPATHHPGGVGGGMETERESVLDASPGGYGIPPAPAGRPGDAPDGLLVVSTALDAVGVRPPGQPPFGEPDAAAAAAAENGRPLTPDPAERGQGGVNPPEGPLTPGAGATPSAAAPSSNGDRPLAPPPEEQAPSAADAPPGDPAVDAVAATLDAEEVRPPGPPPCGYERHRCRDWRLAEGGPVTCGVCHPPAAGVRVLPVGEAVEVAETWDLRRRPEGAA